MAGRGQLHRSGPSSSPSSARRSPSLKKAAVAPLAAADSPPVRCRRAASPARMQDGQRLAQADLIEKLRVMDFELERIELFDKGASLLDVSSGKVLKRNFGAQSKENHDPLSLANAAEVVAPRIPLASTCGFSDGITPDAVLLPGSCDGSDRHQWWHDAIDRAWHENCSALRSEFFHEFSCLRKDHEQQKQSSLKLLTDFEIELTEALEERSRETDRLLESRLAETGSDLQQRLSDLEVPVKSSALQELVRGPQVDDLQRRISDIESAAQCDRERLAETGKSCGEALRVMKDQLKTVRKQLHQLQESSSKLSELDGRLQQVEGLQDQLHQAHKKSACTSSELNSQLQQQGNSLRELGVQVTASFVAARENELLTQRLDERLGQTFAALQDERRFDMTADHLAAHLEGLSTRLATLEKSVSASVVSSSEIQEELATWPVKFEELASRVACDHTELSAALHALVQERVKVVEGEATCRRVQLEGLLARQAELSSEQSELARHAAFQSQGLERLEAMVSSELSAAIGATLRRSSIEAPWLPHLRELECELKDLLAAQLEDSTAAFQSMMLMIEEQRTAPPSYLPPSSA